MKLSPEENAVIGELKKMMDSLPSRLSKKELKKRDKASKKEMALLDSQRNYFEIAEYYWDGAVFMRDKVLPLADDWHNDAIRRVHQRLRKNFFAARNEFIKAHGENNFYLERGRFRFEYYWATLNDVRYF